MKTIINIKADKEIKRKAQKIADELGLSLSAVINAYLRQFIRNKEVYFRIGSTMSPELEKFLEGVEEDLKNKKNISRAISSEDGIKKHFFSL